MRIAKRLWLSAAATVTVVVLLLPVLYWNFFVYVETQRNNALVKSIHDNFFERASFRDQYFLHREDRLRLLWDESKMRSDQLLVQARSQFRDETARKTLERIGRAIDDTALMFHRVVDNTASLNSATGNRNVFEELDKRLYSQLLLKAAELRDAIGVLQDSSSRQVQQAQQRFIAVAGALALLLALVIVLNAVQIGGLIRRRLALLHQGASRVTHGNIEFRIVREGVDEFSEIAGAINLMMDALAQREETIKQAAHYARSLLEASLDPMVTISREGKITDVNEATVRMTGTGRAALIGSDFAGYFTDAAKAGEGYRQALAEGFVTDYALAIRHTSGSVTDVLYNASVYRDGSGKVAGVFASARDVSERKKVEELLKTTEQRLDLALLHSEMGVWDLDLIHDTAWRTLQHDRIFGYESAPATWGQEIALRHVVPEDRDHFVRCFQEASGTGRFFLECRVIHPDQSIHWIQAQAQVLAYEDGRPARMLGTVVDITKQRAAQDTLEQSARALARSNADLEQFAYIASHDLQEPLRMVVGYVQLLEKRLADKLDANTREFMGYAVDGALRMQTLIDDILTYSRVSTRAEPLAPVDSGAALTKALEHLAMRIAETGAKVDAQSLPVVMADQAQLVQLFQNLIANAIKFCKDRAPRVRVEAVRAAGRWRFTVSDNGIGIAPEYRGQLFVVFKRLHTRREYPGTGIGLAICKRIVERHGGEIGIDSAAEGGAVFWFTLPEEKTP